MSGLEARIEGVGFWAPGLPAWADARAFARGEAGPDDAAPGRPAPQLLAPNERRRAPDSVAVALEVALAACRDAGRDPASLPAVFASSHGELAITDYMCATLASDPRAISPTRFHNSVHNAAAGYWTIGAGCHAAATALSAGRGSFAEGLLEALAQLHTGAAAVLLAGYDTASTGPLGEITVSRGLLGGALVLAAGGGDGPRLRLAFDHATADGDTGALASRHRANAMSPMLPMFDTLAVGGGRVRLEAGAGRALRVEIQDD